MNIVLGRANKNLDNTMVYSSPKGHCIQTDTRILSTIVKLYGPRGGSGGWGREMVRKHRSEKAPRETQLGG